MDKRPKGFTGEKHPEVYESYPRSHPRKPGQLTDEQLSQFHEDGYLLVKDFFSQEEINKLREEVKRLVNELAHRLFDAHKITNLYTEKSFYDRLICIENEFPGSNIILHKIGILTEPFQTVASNEKMLNLLEDLLGPNISFSPVWNLRTKTPKNEATVVPWHQDASYFSTESYAQLIIGAWIPLVHAKKENGTMQMVKKVHKEALVGIHECCAGPTWYTMLDEMEIESRFNVSIDEDSEIMDVPEGSFILFNQFTPHRSLSNTSDIVRWALDFRWQKTGTSSCFFNLKEGSELRRGNCPDFKPNWNDFNAVNRNTAQHEASGCNNDEFNTTIMGPWMGQWNLVNHNRHTEAFVDDPNKWDPRMLHG